MNLDDCDNDGFEVVKMIAMISIQNVHPMPMKPVMVSIICDGEVDEDSSIDALTWYIDVDGDGVGSDDANRLDGQSATMTSCNQPVGYVGSQETVIVQTQFFTDCYGGL